MNREALNRGIAWGVGLACLCGCASQEELRREKKAAFQAGQQRALQQLYEARFPVVTVIGPVRVPKLDWTEDLTLARAIVAADYQGGFDPREIILRRGREEVRIKPAQLLKGDDWPLQGGDQIEILP